MPRMLFATVAACAALIGGAPAAAEGVETTAQGFVTRDAVYVAATPLKTWLALTKPGDWWQDEHTWSGDAANMTLTPQGGGCFCERIPGADSADGPQMSGSVLHATVVQAHPLKVLRLRGGLGPLQSEPATGVLTMTLKEVDGGTRVLWEYNVGGPMRYKPTELAPLVDKVLTAQLQGLRAHLGPLDPPSDGEGADASPAEVASDEGSE